MAIDPLARPATILPTYEAQSDTLPLARLQLGAKRQAAQKDKFSQLKALDYWDVDRPFFQKMFDDIQRWSDEQMSKGINPYDEANPKNRGANMTLNKLLVTAEEAAKASANQRDKVYGTNLATLRSNLKGLDAAASQKLLEEYKSSNPYERSKYPDLMLVPREEKIGLYDPLKNIAATSSNVKKEEGAVTTETTAPDTKIIKQSIEDYMATPEGEKYANDNFSGDADAAKSFLQKNAEAKVNRKYAKTLDEEKLGYSFGDGWTNFAGYHAQYVPQGSGIETLEKLKLVGFRGFLPKIEEQFKKHDGILITSSLSGKDPQPQRWNPVSGEATSDLFRPYFIYEENGKYYVQGETIAQKYKRDAQGKLNKDEQGNITNEIYEEKSDETFELEAGGNKENFEKVFLGGRPIEEMTKKQADKKSFTKAEIEQKAAAAGYSYDEYAKLVKAKGIEIKE